MTRRALLVAVLAACAASASAVFPSVPIPKRSAQLNLGEDYAPILLEAHVDLLCPDCAEAWTTLKDLAQAYGRDKIQLGIRPYPLPHHRNGFVAAQAVQAVRAANESAVFKFIDLLFDAQSHFWDAQRSMSDVGDELAALAEAAGVAKATYQSKMATQSVDLAARNEWRLGASRAVSSTPTFFVNGAPVGADEHWSIDLWRSVLDPLLVGEGESHGTQHWSLDEWKAALGPLLESHKRKTDPLLSAVAARNEAARAGDKPTAGEAAVAKATAEAAAKIEADKEEAAKQAAAKEKAAKDAVDEKAAKTAAAAKEPAKEVKPAVSRLEALKREVVGATAAGATTAAATAGGAAKQAAATGAPHEKSLVEKIEEGIEAAEAAVAGVAQVLSGGAAGGAKGGGEVAALAGGGDASLSPEQQKKVQEMKARLGLVAVQQAHHRHRRRLD